MVRRTLSLTSILDLLQWSGEQVRGQPDHDAPPDLTSSPQPALTGIPRDSWHHLPAIGQVVLVRDDARPTLIAPAFFDGQDWLQPTHVPVWLTPLTAWRPLETDAPVEPTTQTTGEPER